MAPDFHHRNRHFRHSSICTVCLVCSNLPTLRTACIPYYFAAVFIQLTQLWLRRPLGAIAVAAFRPVILTRHFNSHDSHIQCNSFPALTNVIQNIKMCLAALLRLTGTRYINARCSSLVDCTTSPSLSVAHPNPARRTKNVR